MSADKTCLASYMAGVRSGLHLLGTSYVLMTDPLLQSGLAGLLIGPGGCYSAIVCRSIQAWIDFL
jgi:hypothetical protein